MDRMKDSGSFDMGSSPVGITTLLHKEEIKEETGLDVVIEKGFREISEYCPFGKIRKRVVFFLAQAFTDNVKIQEEEIDSYIWVDLQQARKMCSYDNDLRIIEKAETAIHLLRN